IVISQGKALIVDPGRDIYAYADLVKKENLSVEGVFLTHSHADFVAGHMELVKVFNCPIYQSAKSNAEYKIVPVEEGTTIEIGNARIKFIETPGHVIDGLSALVRSSGKEIPELILTGDYLFVGGVGRPDLVQGTTSAALAGMIFDIWTNKISKLDDSVKIFPAHGAGSLCGAHLKDLPYSTIGQERASNPNLQYTARSEFITAVLSELQEPPQYFKHNAAMNKNGPDLIDWENNKMSEIPADISLTDSAKYYVVDIRDSKEYAQGHITNSVNIGLRGRLETWVGIMVPWGSDIVLCGSEAELKEAVYRLYRVGYAAKVIRFEDWQKAALGIAKNNLIKPSELYSLMQKGTDPVIVDVRLPNEWMGLRIGTVLNLPLNKLSILSSQLNPDEPVVTVCNSAYRSSMAVGVLERNGFKNISSLDGGSEAWIDAGLPVYGAETKTAAISSAKKEVPLPERISADELKRLLMDLPGTFDLIDIRPAENYKDYSLPGSVNVDISDLINNPSYLTGAGPLIIIDRDGSLAMAVGGILSQKTKRQIKALYGGLEAYWSETELNPDAMPQKINSTPTQITPSVPASKPNEQKPQTTKKKSAGC
ncbi:MAG TPA: rhodanese-like domain-containing protein, partial [Sedimentisphaerales bacterium]|nr:rhodanese-like domain-containing protein [Sedimentisphaerales bacterium]